MHVRDYDRLSIQVAHLDSVAILTIQGEIDNFTAPVLRESIEAVCKLGVPVELDMAQVTFMDSAGVSELIAASSSTNGPPSSLHITKPSSQVRRILLLTGLDKMLPPES